MKYTVHSATPVTVIVPAVTEGGTKVDGHMPGLNVELLPVGGGGKTVTLDLTAENWSGDPKEIFFAGNIVKLGVILLEKSAACVAAEKAAAEKLAAEKAPAPKTGTDDK